MTIQEQINSHLKDLPGLKRADIEALHQRILQIWPGCKLWFEDGKDSENKTVANPAIGYGSHIIKYANGKSKEWFKIGVSANKAGISVYILGIKDRTYLARMYGKGIGKANVTGYCIRFKALRDINIEVLEAAIRYGLDLEATADR